MQEIIELSEAHQQALWKEVALAMKVVKATFEPEKLNVAAIGNVVSN